MSFEDEQNSIRQNVIDLCQKFPVLKGDYRKLLQFYWYHVDGLKQYVAFGVLEQLTQPESICRAFRKAVEERDILLTEPEVVVRREREAQFRVYYDPRKTVWVKEKIV